MSISKKLDIAIKAAETNTTSGEYVIGGRKYETYMTNAEWESFKTAMSPNSLAEYSAGGGDEHSEKNGRPPKMACYGSSSRMIYKLSCHKANFHYEKKLPTTLGGTANIDGFLDDGNRYLFVEAKCREPYSRKNGSVSKSYEKLYDFINSQIMCNVEIVTKPSKCGRYLDAEYYADGEKLEYFDMKQMICHLLGIATGILNGSLEQKQIDFIYLIYDPTELDIEDAAKEEIDSIYLRTCYECNLVDFSTLLRVIFDFLKKEKYGEAIPDYEIDEIIYKFTFTLASQEFYPILLQ